MSNNQKPVSQEYHNGMSQAFKVIGIYLDSTGITKEQFEHERDFYLSAPVIPPSKEKIELLEMKENTKAIKEFTATLAAVPAAIEKAKQALESIGLEATQIKS